MNDAALALQVEAAEHPKNHQRERQHKDDENDSAFPALFSQRTPAPLRPKIVITPSAISQRNRGIQPAAYRVCSPRQVLALQPRLFLRASRRFFDHSLQLLHLLAQFILATRKFLLPGVERGGRFLRTTRHPLALRRKQQHDERDQPEDDQRQ